MVDMTLNDPETKVKVIHFGTNRFLTYDFLQAVNSNFCSRTHCLATIHTGWARKKLSHIPFYRAMNFSAKRGIAIACRLSVCL